MLFLFLLLTHFCDFQAASLSVNAKVYELSESETGVQAEWSEAEKKTKFMQILLILLKGKYNRKKGC